MPGNVNSELAGLEFFTFANISSAIVARETGTIKRTLGVGTLGVFTAVMSTNYTFVNIWEKNRYQICNNINIHCFLLGKSVEAPQNIVGS